MSAKSGVKQDFVLPILVLVIICLLAGVILAITNGITAPVIEASEKAAAEAARIEIMPKADGFEQINAEGLPDSVTEVYKATNGCGYVFMLSCPGYGGKDTLKIICGIDSAGNITSTGVLSHKETAGLGTKIMEPDFKDQFVGHDSDLTDIATISGVTFSSNYYIGGIRDAFAAYEIVKDGVE